MNFKYLETSDLGASKTVSSFILLLLALSAAYVSPRVKGASVEIDLKDLSSAVRVESRLFQNMTSFPEVKAVVSGLDLDDAQVAFQSALSAKNSSLVLSSLSVNVTSSRVWLNVTARFTVDGVSKPERGVIWTALSWISFQVTSDLKYGNLSYNLVGPNYLRPILERLPNQTGIKYYSPIFTPITAGIAVNTAGNVSSLDFRPVAGNVSSWTRSFDATSGTTVWETPTKKSLDLRVEIKTENVSKTLYSFTDTYARVSVQGHGMVLGDTVVADSSSGQNEVVMLGVVVGLVSLGAVAYSLERKITKRLRK